MVVLVAAGADLLIEIVLLNLPVLALPIQYPGLVCPVVLVWYIVTELGSITENAVQMGAPVPGWLVKLLAPGYGPEQAALTANLARIMFPSVVFMGVGMVLTGICNAHYRFAVSAFAPGMSNIIIIVSLLFFSAAYGIFGAAWGTLLSFVGFFCGSTAGCFGRLVSNIARCWICSTQTCASCCGRLARLFWAWR